MRRTRGSFADYTLFQWDRIQPEGAGRSVERGSEDTARPDRQEGSLGQQDEIGLLL